MTWKRSLLDAWLVARFEVLRAIRTWQALALLLVYLLANVGAAYLFIEALSVIEDQIADQLMVPRTRWPGALMDEVLASEQVRKMVETMVGDEATAELLLGVPLLAIFQLWISVLLVPFLAATSAAETIAGDVRSRAIRYEALRTGRIELLVGRFGGQLGMSAVAIGVSVLGVFLLGQAIMVGQPVVETLVAMVSFGVRAVFIALPFAAWGIVCSAWTSSQAWSRVLAMSGVAASWLAYGTFVALRSDDDVGAVTDVLLPLFPQSWFGGLWRGPAEIGLAALALVGLSLAVLVLGYLRLDRRDL